VFFLFHFVAMPDLVALLFQFQFLLQIYYRSALQIPNRQPFLPLLRMGLDVDEYYGLLGE
jgi:hypothetical protein